MTDMHKLLGVSGYFYKQAHCSCGWNGRKWESTYGFNVGGEAKKIAKNEWRAHKHGSD